MVDRRDRDDIDAAYAAAADALSDEAAARHRKAAVLAALRHAALPGDRADAPATAVPAQPAKPSANDSSGPRRRGRSPVWSGLAAACVIGFGSLLVLRVNEVAPPDGTEPTRGSLPVAEALKPDRAPPQATLASPRITSGVDSEVARPGANPGSAASTRGTAPPLETNPPRADPLARKPSQAPIAAPRLERSVPRAAPGELTPPPAVALAEVPRQAPPPHADQRSVTPAAPAAVRSFPQNSAESTRAAPSLEPIERATPMATADAPPPPAAPVPARPPIAERARRGADGAAGAAGSSASLLDLGNDRPDAQAQGQGQSRTFGQAQGQGQAKAESLAPAAAWRADGLIAAVEAGDLVRIRQLLQSQPADAEVDAGGRSALIHAVQRANLPAVELMLAAGADPGRPDRQGQSALAYAARLGDAAILAALRRR